MKYNEIFESPQKIPPADFGLNNRQINQRFATKQMKKVTELIEDNDAFSIVRTGNGFAGWILLYNKKSEMADYVVQYKVRNWKWLVPTVTQCIIWRNALSPFVRRITEKMFFDYLLPKYNAIMSDSQQTVNGNDFWLARLVDANLRNLKIGIANVANHAVIWYDANVDGTVMDWITNKDTFSEAEKYQNIRYVIKE